MRIMWRAWGLGALIAAGLIVSNGTLPASDAPVVHVKAVVKDGGVQLEAQANAPFEYTSYRPSESLYVLDLSGVSAGDTAGARVVPSDLVKSYRVSTYASGNKPVVRVEILMTQGVEPRLERKDAQDLTLLVSRTPDATANPSAAPASQSTPTLPPAVVPATAKSEEAKTVGTTYEAIQQVHLTQNGDQTEVNISGSGPLNYHATQLHKPERLVLDFAGSHLKTSENHLASNLDPVREIRLAQYTPEISRVVIDLRQPAIYNIAKEGNTVTVSFTPSGASSGAPKPAPVEQSGDVMTTKVADPQVAPPAQQTALPKPGEIPAPAAVLPVALTRTSAALAAPAAEPVHGQETVAATHAASEASMVASNVPSASPAPAVAADPPPAPAPAPIAAPAQAPAPVVAGKYSGEPISVNLKEVDLRDFFRLIHEISGLNVVLDPNVKGTLTIVLDDVPWDQALDIVLKNNDLDKQLDGNVLRIATKATLQREAEENRDLAKAQAEAADVVTTTRVLSYAKATTLALSLKKFLSSRGDMVADDRSNTLIIRDVPSTMPVLDNLIRQLDRKSRQVEIEARVVAANRSFSRELGSQLAFSGAAGHNAVSGAPSVGAGPTTFTPAPIVTSTGSGGGGGSSSTGGAPPLITNLGTGAPTSGLQYLFASTNFAIDYVISAAEERGVGKLLSKPKVITQNNEKATVKQGTKIPVQTIVNNTVSVQFVDAVLELDVTPQITAEGTIYMDVIVENDQIDEAIPRVQGIPAIDTQSAETKVTVVDGATVVIGGIIVTTQRTDIQDVPLIGSIPLLGNLFKHTTVSSSSQELLFFLTPRILPS
jgi:type IV pilus secretin PilQ/predicted competence protein